jgi:acylphosphatase
MVKQAGSNPEIRYFLGALQLVFEQVTREESNHEKLQGYLTHLRDDSIAVLAEQEKPNPEDIVFSEDVQSPRARSA